MRNMQAFSDVVVLAIKAALAPVEAKLAAVEQRNADLLARIDELSGLRDRLTTVETKTAQPAIVERTGPTEAEIRLWILDGAKAAAEPLAKDIDHLLDRVTLIESKPPTEALTQTGPTPAEVELSLRDKLEPLSKQVAGISERVAVLEVKAPVPGPAGQDGKNGADGLNGKDGADGLGFDDLIAEQTDERSFTVKAQRGDRIKEIGTLRFPVQIQRGVYVEGKSYQRGDLVTWGGSQWHANEETASRPGEGTKAWTLVVKRGRDGKDGKDVATVPVVSIGGVR